MGQEHSLYRAISLNVGEQVKRIEREGGIDITYPLPPRLEDALYSTIVAVVKEHLPQEMAAAETWLQMIQEHFAWFLQTTRDYSTLSPSDTFIREIADHLFSELMDFYEQSPEQRTENREQGEEEL